MTIQHRLPFFALLLASLALPGCDGRMGASLAPLSSLAGGGSGSVPGDVLPDPVVDAVSVWFFDAQKRQLAKEGRISRNPRYVEPVERVFARVAQAAAKSPFGDRAEAQGWELVVVEDPRTCATAMPGGKMLLCTGIFDLAPNEAALAAVIGHEMIHVLARHVNQRITRDLIAGLPGGIIVAGTAAKPEELDPKVTLPVIAALGLGVFKGVDQPFSRELESEADNQGMLLAASAGYDPDAALNFWVNLDEQPRTEYHGSHPGSGQRIADLQDRMDAFRVAYERADSKHPAAPLLALVTE